MSPVDARSEYAGLIRAAATGDRQAMETLLVRVQEVAYRFSLLVCGHPQDAEDVMQEALLKTCQHVGRISEPEAFRTWLYTTVRNACLMKRRRRAGEPPTFVSVERGFERHDGIGPVDVPDQSRSVDQQLIDGWVDVRLHEALKHLPESSRAVVVMREIDGLSTREGDVLANISGYLDGELDAVACAAIEQHCLTCSSCAAVVKGLRETIGLCRQAATVRLPEDVRRRVCDSVRQLLDRHLNES